MPDQDKDDPERRWQRAKTIATIADAVARLLEVVLRR
jgi:hypothetical protein